jgi:hypothetical protein
VKDKTGFAGAAETKKAFSHEVLPHPRKRLTRKYDLPLKLNCHFSINLQPRYCQASSVFLSVFFETQVNPPRFQAKTVQKNALNIQDAAQCSSDYILAHARRLRLHDVLGRFRVSAS